MSNLPPRTKSPFVEKTPDEIELDTLCAQANAVRELDANCWSCIKAMRKQRGTLLAMGGKSKLLINRLAEMIKFEEETSKEYTSYLESINPRIDFLVRKVMGD